MQRSPRNPICTTVAAALGPLAPDEAARWAGLLAQPAAAMGPAERRARLALRIALLQQAVQPPSAAPQPPDAHGDGPLPGPPAPAEPSPDPLPADAGAPDPATTGPSLPEPAAGQLPAAPLTPQRQRKRRPAPATPKSPAGQGAPQP